MKQKTVSLMVFLLVSSMGCGPSREDIRAAADSLRFASLSRSADSLFQSLTPAKLKELSDRDLNLALNWGDSTGQYFERWSAVRDEYNRRNPRPLTYEVVSKQDVSYAGTPRMVYHIILTVDSLPSAAQIRRVSEAIWSDGNRRWAEFTVYSHIPGTTVADLPYAVAEFRPHGLIEFRVGQWALR